MIIQVFGGGEKNAGGGGGGGALVVIAFSYARWDGRKQ